MAGFGSGLAHALTTGVVDYGQGEEEQRKKLIALAATRRAEERQKEQENIARIGALTNAAQAGLTVTPDTTGGAPLGKIGGTSISMPEGGLIGKAARDDAAKNQARTAERQRRVQLMNAKLPAGHPSKLSDEQVAAVANDDSVMNDWLKGALGIGPPKNIDPRSKEGIDADVKRHQSERDYDVAHPTAQQEPLVLVADPNNPQGPGMYVPRGQAAGQSAPGKGGTARSSVAMQKAIASNTTQTSIIDDALAELDRHPDAVGAKRGMGDFIPLAGNVADAVNQRTDPEGVAARASLANISSLIIHDRSGAAVTVSEFPRLAPFIPRVSDTPETIRTKLRKLRDAIQIETHALQQGAGKGPATDGASHPASGRTYTYGGTTYRVP